jgi:hypothetical protein
MSTPAITMRFEPARASFSAIVGTLRNEGRIAYPVV